MWTPTREYTSEKVHWLQDIIKYSHLNLKNWAEPQTYQTTCMSVTKLVQQTITWIYMLKGNFNPLN